MYCFSYSYVWDSCQVKHSIYHTVKNIGGEKTLANGKLQHFAKFFTISITFPMQTDFNSPQFFQPNFLQSLFAKVCTAKVFYCTVYLCYGDICDDIYLLSQQVFSWQHLYRGIIIVH